MKVKDFHLLLRDSESASELSGPAKSCLLTLASAFEPDDTTAVKTKFKGIELPPSLSRAEGGSSVGFLIRALQARLSAMPQKRQKSARADFKLLMDISKGREHLPMIEFVESLRSQFALKAKRGRGTSMTEEQIKDYVSRLESVVADPDAFRKIIDEIESDSRVKQSELAAIANAFYGHTAASTSKRESLRRIWSRHHAKMDFFAKARAQTGKSAA